MTDVATSNGSPGVPEPPYPPPPPPAPLAREPEVTQAEPDDDGTPPWLRGEYRKALGSDGQLRPVETAPPAGQLAVPVAVPPADQFTINRRTAALIGLGVLILGLWWMRGQKAPPATPAAPTETTVKIGGLKTVADKDRVVTNTDGRVCVVRYDALRVAGGDIGQIKDQITQANTFYPGTPVDDLYIGGGGTADQVIVSRQRSTEVEVKLVACPAKPIPPTTTTVPAASAPTPTTTAKLSPAVPTTTSTP